MYVPQEQTIFQSESSQVYTLHVIHNKLRNKDKQQTTIRKPIECAPEASRGGREWAETLEGEEVTELFEVMRAL